MESSNLFPTLAEIEHEQSHYEYYLARLQAIQADRQVELREPDRRSAPEYYKRELIEPAGYGELTAIILKARFYAKYPDGVEGGIDGYGRKATDRLNFYDAIESTGDNIVDAVWGEWADMGSKATKAQLEILCALERRHWAEADWDLYREQQRIRQAGNNPAL